MNLRKLMDSLEGDVIRMSPRTLSDHEMASIAGGGPTIQPGDDDPIGATPSYSPVNGAYIPDDCQD